MDTLGTGWRDDPHAEAEGEKLTGSYTNQFGKADILDGTLKGDAIKFKVKREFNGQEFVIQYSGKLAGDKITGKAEFDINGENRGLDWQAKREAAKASATGNCWSRRIKLWRCENLSFNDLLSTAFRFSDMMHGLRRTRRISSDMPFSNATFFKVAHSHPHMFTNPLFPLFAPQTKITSLMDFAQFKYERALGRSVRRVFSMRNRTTSLSSVRM